MTVAKVLLLSVVGAAAVEVAMLLDTEGVISIVSLILISISLRCAGAVSVVVPAIPVLVDFASAPTVFALVVLTVAGRSHAGSQS